jgi:hypothetical protein
MDHEWGLPGGAPALRPVMSLVAESVYGADRPARSYRPCGQSRRPRVASTLGGARAGEAGRKRSLEVRDPPALTT